MQIAKIISLPIFNTISYLITLLLLSGFGCSSRKSDKREVEEGVDRIKLSILSSFKNDSLKIKAAHFILEQLPSHGYADGEVVNAYNDTIIKYAQAETHQLHALALLKEKKKNLTEASRHDAIDLTPDYLINHISTSVNNYRNYKWDNEISFEDFCQYILPYRIGREYPGEWVTYYQTLYFRDNDSTILHSDLEERISLVLQWLKKRKGEFKIKKLDIPEISVTTSDKLFAGSCHELTKISISTLRSFGIPATVDFTPAYSNRNGEHEWAVITQNNTCRTINAVKGKIEMDVDTTERRFSKVYRKSFQKNTDNHFAKRGYSNAVPGYFNDPYLQDVTHEYYNTFDANIPIPSGMMSHFGYLAVFNEKQWIPVAWGEREQDLLHFKNLPGNTVYLPISMEEKRAILGFPFLLTTSGEVHEIKADTLHTEKISLTRKYPLYEKIKIYISRTVGGFFEGSNDPDFKKAEVLYKVTSDPGPNYNMITLNNKKKFRYLRYVSPPNSHCNIGDVSFFGPNGMPLNGTIIGSEGSWDNDTTRDRRAVFDGDPLTFFDYKNPDGGWAGIDLGNAQVVSTIRFIARTDVNIIEEGTTYELFYWNKGWTSLGQKVADSPILTYNNVPRGALLWLRNLRGGMEERIFQYANGEQIWR